MAAAAADEIVVIGPEGLPPLHRAAYEGNLAEVDRLIEEDAGRLNAQLPGGTRMGATDVDGCTPLILAACNGHDAVVGRLLALGADVGLCYEESGLSAAHWACFGDHASTLALLLDAGASVNARIRSEETLLILAASLGATECVQLLLAHGGGESLELDIMRRGDGWTALHTAAFIDHEITQLLLQAGADPTIRSNGGRTPLDLARMHDRQPCIPLLEAAVAEPQRPRLLLKARALLDAAVAVPKAFDDARDKGEPLARGQRAALAAAPAYLRERVAWAGELPGVFVNDDAGSEEKLVACLQYALGLAYGGGVHFEGEEKPVGMLREVFVELCELLVPKWERASV